MRNLKLSMILYKLKILSGGANEMVIDEEFKQLIPPLTEEEYKGLEASIISEGCRDALIVWGDILIDGHNRYEICTLHNIPYKTIEMNFNSRNEALLWIMRNQLSRRNLNDLQRIELVRKCEDAVKAQAKERQVAGLIQNENTVRENLPEREQEGKRATDELGAMAGVSRKTYEHATEVLDKAPEPIVEAARNKELSINAAYEVTQMPQEQQDEIAERIEQGEKPKAVVNEVKKRKPMKGKTKAQKDTQGKSKPKPKIEQELDNIAQNTEFETNSVKYKVILLKLGAVFNLDELKKLQVEKLAEDDCALFLQCSCQILQEVFRSTLWEDWGFEYQTVAFLMMKSDEPSEICILSARGQSILTALPKIIDVSEKELREFIKEVVGDVPICELPR